MRYSSDMVINVFILCFVVAIFCLSLWGQFGPERYSEETELKSWTCENCGFRVECMTIEGLVEGMRIHSTSYDCEEE